MQRRLPRKQRRGFSMFEVVLALVLFTMIALMVGTIIPIAARSTRFSNDYSQASTLALHKINQLHEAGYENMNATDMIDSGIADTLVSGDDVKNTNGDQVISFSFTTNDRLSEYFTGGVADPRGWIDVAPYTPSGVVVGSDTVYSLIQVTIRITWRDGRGNQQRLSMTSLVPKSAPI